jgi:hypothetical protein
MSNEATKETKSKFPTSLSELAERSSSLVMHVRMECRQPDLADDLRQLIDQYSWIVRLHQIATEENADKREVADLEFSHELLTSLSPAMEEIVEFPAAVAKHSPKLAETAKKMLKIIATCAPSDGVFLTNQPEEAPRSVNYAQAMPAPNTWRQVQRDHEILLALVRGYRFLLESDDRQLRAHGHDRLSLIRMIRGIEVRASAKGTTV